MFETSEKRTGKLQRNEEKTGQTNKNLLLKESNH